MDLNIPLPPPSPEAGLTHPPRGNPSESRPAEAERGSHEEGPSPHGGYMQVAPAQLMANPAEEGEHEHSRTSTEMELGKPEIEAVFSQLASNFDIFECLHSLGSNVSLEWKGKTMATILKHQLKEDLSTAEYTILGSAGGKLYPRVKADWTKLKTTKKKFLEKKPIWGNPFSIPSELQRIPPDAKQVDMGQFMEVDEPEAPQPSSTPMAYSTKRKKVGEVIKGMQQAPFDIAAQAAVEFVKPFGGEVSHLWKKALVSPSKGRETVKRIRRSEGQKPYTPEEALAFMIDHDLSTRKYKSMYDEFKARGYDILPPPHKVDQVKKECYPAAPIELSDRTASVPLDSLLNHTAERALKVNTDVVQKYMESRNLNEVNVQMIASWGFDGSGNQSQYKQRLDDKSTDDDHSLFATTLIPLKISPLIDIQELWQNPTPQSIRYCRPLRLQFKKESKQVILEEKKWVEDQINELTEHVVNIPRKEVASSSNETPLPPYRVVISYKLCLTAIDGKVLSHITGTRSMASCPICKALPSQLNNLHLCKQKPIDPINLSYGISPLHAWIRVLEFCLHLGYRVHPDLRTWAVRKNKRHILDERKAWIQQKLFKSIGIRVDFVGPNGTSNDGNTARRALSEANREIFAETLGKEKWLVEGLHTILTVLSCGLAIDSQKFGEFCIALAQKYVETYPWFYMPSTIHKILVHGQVIIESSMLPVGVLSEQASESRNKLYRRYREHHAYHGSRSKTIGDVFRRSLQSSDPVISDERLFVRQSRLKRQPLSLEAMKLLETTDIGEQNLDVYDEEIENIDIDMNIELLNEFSDYWESTDDVDEIEPGESNLGAQESNKDLTH